MSSYGLMQGTGPEPLRRTGEGEGAPIRVRVCVCPRNAVLVRPSAPWRHFMYVAIVCAAGFVLAALMMCW